MIIELLYAYQDFLLTFNLLHEIVLEFNLTQIYFLQLSYR